MWKKFGKWILIGFALLAIVGTMNNAIQKLRLRATIDDYKRVIAHERLVGKGPAEVIAFLDRENLPHGGYQPKANPMESENYERTIRGEIPVGSSTFSLIDGPFVWEVMFRFEFDTQHKLVDYYVNESAVGF